MVDAVPTPGPLSGLRAVNLSSTLVGAFAGQVLADYGAEVILVEPPGGHPLRGSAGWPVLARGARSLVADLCSAEDRTLVAELAAGADVVLETWRPSVADRLGLGYDQLSARNPGLVHTSVTGFGRDNALSSLKAYEGIVLAKIGGLDQFSALLDREGPGFPTVPYCSWSAAHLALHGTFAALIERERSGRGQRVETTLTQAIAAHDVFNWMVRLIGQRYAGAFTAVPVVDPGTQVPNGWMSYALLVALTKDGAWLQFSQATAKLFAAFLRVLGVDGPEWAGAWEDEDVQRRGAFRDLVLGIVRSKTLAEWQATFDANPDVFAEVFRRDQELLDHPQLLHDHQVVEIDEPGLGRVRQSGPIAWMSATPGRADRPSPALDADRESLLGAGSRPPADFLHPEAEGGAGAGMDMPLSGITILELGTFFAGPFGATLLTDLGARVIKIEQHDGDPIRWQLPMPEIGAIKVLLGKESVAVDINTPEGRALVLDIAKTVDFVLCTFRAGVAARVGLDEAAIRAVNPDVVYHDAVGFGTDGPYAHRPAYAPTIGAGSGQARRNIGDAVPEGPDLSLDQVKRGAVRLGAASLTMGHPDGFSGIGVGTGMLLGLLAKARGMGGQAIRTTMLTTMSNVLSEDMLTYEGRPPGPTADAGLHGFGPLYRLYETSDGWVFLAAPTEREQAALAGALGPADLDAGTLEAVFLTRSAADWEKLLTDVDVACVEVMAGPSHAVLMDDGGLGRQLGMVTDVVHLTLDEHPRLAPVIRFSRSATRALPAPVIGQHTEPVLREFGVDHARMAELRAAGVIP